MDSPILLGDGGMLSLGGDAGGARCVQRTRERVWGEGAGRGARAEPIPRGSPGPAQEEPGPGLGENAVVLVLRMF